MKLTISEVAKRSGIGIDALRYYEREGIVPAPERDSAGRRAYDESVLDHLVIVAALRDAGFGIRDTAAFLTSARAGDTVGERLDSAEAAFARLDAVLDERAAVLRRARRVLSRWRAEVEEARSDLDLERRLTCAGPRPEET